MLLFFGTRGLVPRVFSSWPVARGLVLRVFFRPGPVARGPVPRDRCMARDRPSPYGERHRLWSRSAGDRPPRSLDLPTSVVRERPLPNGSRAGALALQRCTAAELLKRFFHERDRGGQAPALRTQLANLVNRVNPALLWRIVIIV